MASSTICPQCYNSTFHFDESRHAIVCDICGTEQIQNTEAVELYQYDKECQRAIAYIKARDYNSAKPILERMYLKRPDDAVNIMYLHLMGLTECCQNLLLGYSEWDNLDMAKKYWSKFLTLNGDTTYFDDYGERRREARLDECQKNLDKNIIKAFSIYSALFALLALLFSHWYYSLIGIAIIAFILYCSTPLKNIFLYSKKIKRIQKEETPFEH